VVFKRRNPRGIGAWAREMVYPTGGFRRATQYIVHRMRRLPDEPHRIARGVFAGTFVNFPPLFGIQFLTAAGLAWMLRGNILAALLCTFMSNPITTPFIAVGSMELGYWMLGIEAHLDFMYIVAAFADAGGEIWNNIRAIFTSEPTHWESLGTFFRTIYLPYLVGSIIPGLIVSTLFYYLAIPIVRAYQKLRANKTRDRLERRRRLRAAVHSVKEAETARKADAGDDEGRPPV
jgi:uncharacterized protein